MRRAVALIALVLIAACSSGGSGASSSTTSASHTSGSSSSATKSSSATGGAVDCTAIKAAAAELLVPVQLLAQVRDPDSLAAIKSGTIGNLDIDKFLQAVDDLRPLDGYSSALGSAKDSLDFYETAGNALKTLLEASTVTQADIDAYTARVGSVTDVLGKQTAISGALDAAGC